jgi:hypothetical protein
MWILLSLFLLVSSAMALNCDCDVIVYSPMTGSYQMAPNQFKQYHLEGFSSYSVKNQLECRDLCVKRFEADLPSSRLKALLLTYSQELITQGALGYNCTGLTTLKYPVRVKAKLGRLKIGNVVDQIEVINHEELCF